MQFPFQKTNFYLLLLIFAASCNFQNQTPQNNSTEEKAEKNHAIIKYGEHDKVTSGALDKVGNLWFGTSNEGVYCYDGKSFVHFTEKDGLSNKAVNCIVAARDGNLWFGTRDGLCKYDGKTFTQLRVPSEEESSFEGEKWWNANLIQCLLQDRKGDLWIGTGGCGAYRYDGKTFTNLSFTNDSKQADSLHHNFIQSMLEDSDGNLWFTSLTHGSVSRYDGKNTTHFSSSDGLKDDMVFSSFQDKAGNLWFGSIQTTFAGLYRYDGNLFTSFGKEDGLCDNFVTGFFEDKKGELWIRTGSVLCLYDGKTFAPFKTKDGQGLNGISFITEDKNGNIWLGGTYGQLWKYDGETLSDFSQKGR